MASAPELLEACEEVLDLLDGTSKGGQAKYDARKRAEDAIAKAKRKRP
jgi:hypothetical protein